MAKISKKYIIAGLDNSGKTSILLSLQGISNLLSYYSLQPTIGLQIEQIFDKQSEISIWELGGQEQYRDAYFDADKITQFLDGMKKFIFVIDIQEINRYNESLHYFTQLSSHIIKANPEEIICFFHKYDPNLTQNPDFSDETLRNKLVLPIRSLFPNFRNLKFFKSTIFTVFQKYEII